MIWEFVTLLLAAIIFLFIYFEQEIQSKPTEPPRIADTWIQNTEEIIERLKEIQEKNLSRSEAEYILKDLEILKLQNKKSIKTLRESVKLKNLARNTQKQSIHPYIRIGGVAWGISNTLRQIDKNKIDNFEYTEIFPIQSALASVEILSLEINFTIETLKSKIRS
ncbi:MAG: hypothetical protein ACFCUR_10860 [Rhodomicrobiaceae bacterium]